MGPGKRKRSDSERIVIKKEEEFDERLDRRLKRRSIANQHSKLCSNDGKNCIGQPGNSPTNNNNNNNNSTPVSNYIIIDTDDDDDESCDPDYEKFLGGLASGKFDDMDACDDDYAARSIDNCNVDVNVVNGSVENGATDDVAVNDGNVDARPVDCGYVPIKSVDEQTANMSSDDGIVSIRTINDGGNGDASHKDNDIVDGSLDNGIVGDKVDVGNNVDAMSHGEDVHDAHNNDACDMIDPQYKMFLENLREDGKSYVLEISISNEMSILVKYEANNGPHDRFNTEEQETMRGCPVRENIKAKKLFNSCSSTERMETQSGSRREKIESQRKLCDIPAREIKGLMLERNVKKEVVDHISSRVNGLVRPTAAAPGSKRGTMGTQRKVRDVPAREIMSSMVEAKLKKDAVAPVSCRANRGARPSAAALGSRGETMETQRKVRDASARERMSSVIETKPKKEAMDHICCKASGRARSGAAALSSRRGRMETQRKVRDVPAKERMSSAVEIKLEKGDIDSISCRANGRARPSASALGWRRQKKETQTKVWDVPARERMNSVVETNPKNEAVDPISCRVKGHAKKRPSPEACGLTTCKRKREMEPDTVDQEYQNFLNSLKHDGRHAVFMPKSGKKVIYEKDEQSSSDSEVIVMDTDPFCDGNYTPFVTSKEYALYDEEDRDHNENFGKNEISLLKDRLIQILQKPYDEKEYEALWEEVTRVGPVTRDRNLRHRIITYRTQANGKSYLDQFSDLAEEIYAAGCDRPQILNLLRGFFYWLKNVSHQGMFRPWLDAACLKVRPHLH